MLWGFLDKPAGLEFYVENRGRCGTLDCSKTGQGWSTKMVVYANGYLF